MKFRSRIYSAILKTAGALAGILLSVSCTDEGMEGALNAEGEGNVTIQLSSLPEGTRATDPDDTGNENLISDVLVCIFKAGESSDADRPLVMQTVDVAKRTEASISLQINKDVVDRIFTGVIKTAVVHVFANLPAATKAAIPENPTLGQLKGLDVTSNFASSNFPSSFVMHGDGELTLEENVNNTSKDVISGKVFLTRTAAKVGMRVRVKDEVTDAAGRVWKPRLDGMVAYITNGVRTSSVIASTHSNATGDYYSTTVNAYDDTARGRGYSEDAAADPETGYPYVLNRPFYTYPNQWTDESDTMTYMTLMLPWESTGSFKSCYYMVPIVRDQNYLASNVSYRVSINVDILGSAKPDDPLLLDDASYRAVEWGQEAFDVNIDDYRYLVIDNNTYTMNNEGMISIPFYSSHETVIKVTQDTLNYYLFNTTAAGIEKIMSIDNTQRNNSNFTPTATNTTDATYSAFRDSIGRQNMKIYSDWIDNKVDQYTNTRTLYFHHELYQWNAYNGNNQVSYSGYTSLANANSSLSNLNITNYRLPTATTPAYSRYRMTITIVHKDKLNQSDEAQFSEKIVIWQYPPMYIQSQENFYGGTSRTERTPARGNMWVNGNQTQSADDVWYVAYGLGGNSDNANPNQYVIEVTQLSTNEYTISDPRVTTINNLNTGFTGNAPENGWANAPGIENANTDSPTSRRTLSYYYPSNQSSTYMYTVAPRFRIASSYGVAFPMSYAEAQRRCASYQELQYPAGRWRIPTVGEIEYIMNLSNQGKIPALFTMATGNNGTSYYWSAQGRINARLTNGKLATPPAFANNQTASVRCVYDEWYWAGSEIKTTATQVYGTGNNRQEFPKYPFVWGDRAR